MTFREPVGSLSFHISPPSVLILIKINPVPGIISHLPQIHLRLGLPKRLFPSGLQTNTPYVFLDSPIRASCPAHLKRLLLLDVRLISGPLIAFAVLMPMVGGLESNFTIAFLHDIINMMGF